MNLRQADELKAFLEGENPDAGTTVTPHAGGVEIKISGRQVCPGLSGPGSADVVMVLRDGSPLLERYLAVKAARAINAHDSHAAD